MLPIEKARSELGRIAGRTSPGETLTPAEATIAELVARGLAERGIAQSV